MGTPKWMVYMENPIKMDDLGVPPFKETSIYLPDIKPPFVPPSCIFLQVGLWLTFPHHRGLSRNLWNDNGNQKMANSLWSWSVLKAWEAFFQHFVNVNSLHFVLKSGSLLYNQRTTLFLLNNII